MISHAQWGTPRLSRTRAPSLPYAAPAGNPDAADLRDHQPLTALPRLGGRGVEKDEVARRRVDQIVLGHLASSMHLLGEHGERR